MSSEASHVSWLTLERYCLGELPATEAARVQHALQHSEELRRCYERIQADQGRVLPVLTPPVMRPLPRRFRWDFIPRPALAAAATLVVLLAVGLLSREVMRDGAPENRVKGGEVAIDLVRRSGGRLDTEPSVFLEGDEFKVRVTCARQGPLDWQLSVFQGNEVFFPLEATAPLHCGNEVLLPGAFRLTGAQPVLVCLSVEEDVVEPQHLRHEGVRALKASAACAHVRPLGEARE
jgi:hypothetical protein